MFLLKDINGKNIPSSSATPAGYKRLFSDHKLFFDKYLLAWGNVSFFLTRFVNKRSFWKYWPSIENFELIQTEKRVKTEKEEKGLDLTQIVNSYGFYRIYQSDSEEEALEKLSENLVKSIDKLLAAESDQ